VSPTDDWRLTGQERYLSGVSLRFATYAPAPGNDHDHCEFCGTKFTLLDIPGSLRRGYTTDDRYRWICETCFADFLDRFKWRVVPESSHSGHRGA